MYAFPFSVIQPESFRIDLYMYIRADSQFVPSQWEMVLLCNNVSHWLGTNLESALYIYIYIALQININFLYVSIIIDDKGS